jgi:hypothetical protein
LISDPAFGGAKPVRSNRNPVLAAADFSTDEPGRLQDGDVARHSGEAHRYRGGEIADPGIACSQGDQHCASGWIG